MNPEIYYEVEVSLIDADDWYTSGRTYDTLESARAAIAKVEGYDSRIVEVTVSRKVVA